MFGQQDYSAAKLRREASRRAAGARRKGGELAGRAGSELAVFERRAVGAVREHPIQAAGLLMIAIGAILLLSRR